MKKFVRFLAEGTAYTFACQVFGSKFIIPIALTIITVYYLYKGFLSICRWIKKLGEALDIYIQKNKSA